MIGRVASEIALSGSSLTQLSLTPQRVDPIETISAELLPLCSALRFLRKQGPKILRDHRYGATGRPAWLWGVRSKVRRAPRGRVLILGTWNYPLFLPGVQAAQALAAGNDVLLKPAVGSEAVTEAMVEAFFRAGVPRSSLLQLPSHPESAMEAMEQGVDLIVLTGSAATGRKVLERASRTLTPTIMELSGCDAVVVLPGTDIERVAQSISFGLTLNSGATCIGPRRILAEPFEANELVNCLRDQLQKSSPFQIHPAARQNLADLIQATIDGGARDVTGQFDRTQLDQHGTLSPLILDRVDAGDAIASADIFAPVCSLIHLSNIRQAVPIINECPYRLAASVFGPGDRAQAFADDLRVGSVSINDLIVPTADPRVPFGGRGQSGFGVTRGAEGLLAMTVPTVVSCRRGKFVPHLQPRQPSDAQTLLGALQLLHASPWGKRLDGLRQMISAGSDRSRADGSDDFEKDDSREADANDQNDHSCAIDGQSQTDSQTPVVESPSSTQPFNSDAVEDDGDGKERDRDSDAMKKNESLPMENERTP